MGKNKRQAGRNWFVIKMEAIWAVHVICSQTPSLAVLSH